MKEILVKPGGEITLGKRGENLARVVVFDIAGWQMTYGEGRVELLHRRNGDKAPYPCVLKVIGSTVRWELTNADTDKAGRGSCELQYLVNDVVVKSESYHTRVIQALGPAGETPPDPAQGWVDLVLQAGGSNNGPLVAKVEALEDRVAAIESGGGNTGGGDGGGGNTGGGDSGGEPDSELSARVAELAQRLEEHINPYQNIAITNATHNQKGAKEKGTVVENVVVSWTLNRNPQSLTISGSGIEGTQVLAVTDRSYTVPTKLAITADNYKTFKWNIRAVGERGEENGDVSTKEASGFDFRNRIFYGSADEPATFDKNFFKSLTTSGLVTSRVTPIEVNGGGKYIWYCIPTSIGTCKFMSNNFPFDMQAPVTVSYTNDLEYPDSYYVYRSTELIDKTMKIEVSA